MKTMRCVLICALVFVMLVTTTPVGSGGYDRMVAAMDHHFLCTPTDQFSRPILCSDYGPGAYAYDVVPLELPFEVSAPGVLPADISIVDLQGIYARAAPDTPVYDEPEAGVLPVRLLGIGKDVGYIFVSIQETLESNGDLWARISRHEYVRHSDLSVVEPSGFQGVAITSALQRPLAWIVQSYNPRYWPASDADQSTKFLTRHQLTQVFASRIADGNNWYLVGQNEWVEQQTVGIVSVEPRPEGVRGRWIDVNLHEQTLTAYEDERPVYATLVSSGTGEWLTRSGLFQIFQKLDRDDMGGAFASDQSDYYYIEDVPWVMYFDGAIALHGAYWHDRFGFKKSHGCVNLSPSDARWLYEWADKGTWVWVHDPIVTASRNKVVDEQSFDF